MPERPERCAEAGAADPIAGSTISIPALLAASDLERRLEVAGIERPQRWHSGVTSRTRRPESARDSEQLSTAVPSCFNAVCETSTPPCGVLCLTRRARAPSAATWPTPAIRLRSAAAAGRSACGPVTSCAASSTRWPTMSCTRCTYLGARQFERLSAHVGGVAAVATTSAVWYATGPEASIHPRLGSSGASCVTVCRELNRILG